MDAVVIPMLGVQTSITVVFLIAFIVIRFGWPT